MSHQGQGRTRSSEPSPWSLWALFEAAALNQEDSEFIVSEAENGQISSCTFAEARNLVLEMVASLEAAGVSRGDFVHVQLSNQPQFFYCLLAGAYLGLVVVPTNHGSSVDELAYILSHAGCRISVTDARGASVLRQANAMCPELEHVIELSDSRRPSTPSRTEPVDVSALEPALVMYASGTTGWPKGVVLSHHNLWFAGEATAQHFRVSPRDRWLVVLPLHNGNSIFFPFMSSLVSGASLALVERFDPTRWEDQAEHLGATLASLFARQIREILQVSPARTRGRTSMRAVCFAQNVTAAQLSEFEDRVDTRLVQIYGMTETAAAPILNPLYAPRDNMTLGLPALHARIRVVDESGDEVPVGTVGELQVAGEPGRTLMLGYLHKEELTNLVVRDGWLSTGDMVRVDDLGYVTFEGRGEDVIKPGPDNVSAVEVERVIHECPGVLEAAVVAVMSQEGERVKAFVVVDAAEGIEEHEIVTWCRERLAEHKVPEMVEFVDDLPRTAVGKIRKSELRERP